MYSTYNEGKSVVAERFIRTLKNKIYDTISKKFFFDIVNKYNNTVDRTIKMKPIEVMTHYYAEYNEPQMELHSNKKILNLKLVAML